MLHTLDRTYAPKQARKKRSSAFPCKTRRRIAEILVGKTIQRRCAHIQRENPSFARPSLASDTCRRVNILTRARNNPAANSSSASKIITEACVALTSGGKSRASVIYLARQTCRKFNAALLVVRNN
jgi:hypothetical protein